MADTKITALAAITTVDPAVDVLAIVDVSDTTMAASGTTKKITSNQLLGSGGTATLASATITGDLTVDTSTLKVDSTNNYVGVGTAAPIAQFMSVLNATGIAGRLNTNTIGSAISASYQVSGVTSGTLPFGIRCTGNAFAGISGQLYASQIVAESTSALALEMFTTGNTPICFGVNGAETMRLNATGLGIGGTPLYSIQSYGTAPAIATGGTTTMSAAGTIGASLILRSESTSAWTGTREMVSFDSIGNGADHRIGGLSIKLKATSGASTLTEYLQINPTFGYVSLPVGNVGLGVTPSAWLSSYKSIDILAQAAFFASNTAAFVGSNLYVASGGVVTYKTANNASYFAANNSGVFSWYRSNNTPVANGAATFTESMQVDANGNLILQSSATPATLTTNGQLTVNATSNTNLRFSYRGSDGVTRVANITLA